MPEAIAHTPIPGSWVEQQMFTSPYWTVNATVQFDGLRGRATLDVEVSQWFTEKSIVHWTTKSYEMTALLSELFPDLAEALTDTCARVSPF
jgi:hypothetical protein